MFKWINNDTVALTFLGAVAIIGILVGNENVALATVGAIGGYIGAMAKK